MSRSSVYIHRGLLYNTILLFILMLTHTLATQDKRAVTPPPTEGPDRTLQPCACSFPQHERRSYLTILGYDPHTPASDPGLRRQERLGASPKRGPVPKSIYIPGVT